MLVNTIVRYTGESPEKIKRLLNLSKKDVINDSEYQALLNTLDKDRLEELLPEARAAYENGLDNFKNKLSDAYDFSSSPMSAFTLANWLLGFLQYPAQLETLLEQHKNIPGGVLEQGLPELLPILDYMKTGSAEWQRALAILSIPLVAKN